MQSFKFGKRAIDALKADGKEIEYKDDINPALRLRVGKGGKKTFSVFKYVAGKNTRKPIGVFPDVTPEQARIKAEEIIDSLESEASKKTADNALRSSDITLRQVLKDFKTLRGHKLKPDTLAQYEERLIRYFSDWFDLPLSAITSRKIVNRHKDIGESGAKTGANGGIRVLKLMFNFAINYYRDEQEKPFFTSNPVNVLNKSALNLFFEEKRRKNMINKSDLKKWWQAVIELKDYQPKRNNKSAPNMVTCSYLYRFMLLTGLRFHQAVAPTWGNIDLKRGMLTTVKKVGNDSFTIPLSIQAVKLLREWKKTNDSEFVFPNEQRTGPISNDGSRGSVELVVKASGVNFSHHPLRNTFITIAESLDISETTRKRLHDHATAGDKGDVTSGYIVTTIDRLRDATQRISDHIFDIVEDESTPQERAKRRALAILESAGLTAADLME